MTMAEIVASETTKVREDDTVRRWVENRPRAAKYGDRRTKRGRNRAAREHRAIEEGR